MNQRFQELAQEAGLYVDVNGQPWPRNMNGEDIEGAYQRFAELIVRECCNIANEQFSVASGLDDRDCWTAVEIKKHFGVEE